MGSVTGELCSRFKLAKETGDDSHIPPDLVQVTYATVSHCILFLSHRLYRCAAGCGVR